MCNAGEENLGLRCASNTLPMQEGCIILLNQERKLRVGGIEDDQQIPVVVSTINYTDSSGLVEVACVDPLAPYEKSEVFGFRGS